ncbi:unnamed protein product [Ascophyllum nodosum]
MLTRKRTALALGLLAGRAGCLAHPTGSIHKITIRLAANEGKARLFSYPVTAKSATKLSRRVPSRFTEEDCRGSSIRGLRPLERNVRAASGVGRVSFMRLPAVQLMTFRRHARGRATMSTTAAKGTTAVAPPSGGYPPPVHLNGVFAVYKPKGFSSADAVQKIKNVLTKGVREDLRARLASEKAAAEDQAELNGKGESEAVVEVLEAAEGLAEASNQAKFSGVDGTKRKRPNGVQPRRQQGPKVKVGHGGTLDPMATGVLVIGVGRGCRELSDYLEGGKAYRVEALLGHETNTQDAEGEATLHGEWGHVTQDAVDAALGQFTGEIMQVPPMFSALHKDGKRLYELARQGITVERKARPVTVHSLRQVDPPLPLPRLGLEVECGGGFYVRTLVEDLGRALGTRAHMTVLERTKQGPFEVDHALPRERWEYDELCKHLQEAVERRSVALEQ